MDLPTENSNSQPDVIQPNIMSPNPLSKYFRQPAIFINLPSQGEYWPPGSLEMPVTNELPVYPMTTKDEVTLKTPDALMNGSGIVEVVQSCCPNILNAWKMPSIDVDTVLISIRIASYGNNMDFDTACPHCNEENTYTQDLRACLAGIRKPNYAELLKITSHNLQIKLRPQSYFDSNKASKIAVEEQKMLQALESTEDATEVRGAKIQKSMQILVDLALEGMVASTEYILTGDGERVANPVHILEFYKNTDTTLIKVLQERLAEISEFASIPPMQVTCGSCSQDYKVPIEFNYTSFFGKGS